MDTKQPDENADVVDYFLFEQKKGYCVDFAGAMTVLCRCVGIPARYIEGFAMDYKEREEEEYLVKGNRAHAWCEVYLEGYGWLRMDPTPGYGEAPSSIKWLKNPETGETTNGAKGPEGGQSVMAETQSQLQEEKIQEAVHIQNRNQMIFYTAVVIIMLILTTILFVVVRSYKREKRYKKADINQKILLLLERILLYQKLLHQGIYKNETLLEYRSRLEENDLKDALAICEEVRYSNVDADKEDLKKIENVSEKLTGLCLARLGRIRFELYKSVNE